MLLQGHTTSKVSGARLVWFEGWKAMLKEFHPGKTTPRAKRWGASISRTRVAPDMNWSIRNTHTALKGCVQKMMNKSMPKFPASFHIGMLLPIISHAFVALGVPWFGEKWLTVGDLDMAGQFFVGLAVGALDKNRGSAFLA